MRNATFPLLALLLGAFAFGACKTARRTEPFTGKPLAAVLDSEDERRGQLVFMEHCNQCHPNGAAGLGPPINNIPLPKEAIKLKVRTGHPIMPKFSDTEIGDAELDDLADYLLALHSVKPRG